MAIEVIKKDDTKEPFSPDKIRQSIRSAAQEANLSSERTDELAREVGDKTIAMTEEKDVISTKEIKEFILGRLDKVEPAVSAAWRKYDSEKKES